MRQTYGHEPTPAAVTAMGDHLEITIHIGREDAAALGMEAGTLTDWFVSALRTLAALRTGEVDRETEQAGIERVPADLNTWYWAINDLDYRLMPRLDAIRDAAIRAHASTPGGTVGHLALAMDTARSTAQYRREQVVNADPSHWETWATTGGPIKR